MVSIRIRDQESCEPQPQLLWDTVWVQRIDASGGFGDWMLAGPGDQVESRGGLRAEAALHTATMLCLFTDRRLLPDEGAPPDDTGDRRGWWGDSIRIDGEPDVPLGSLLWTLERSTLDDGTARRAEDYAAEALPVLATQGVVARTEVNASADRSRAALLISVAHWGHDGARAYEQRFAVVWAQSSRNASRTFGDGLLLA